MARRLPRYRPLVLLFLLMWALLTVRLDARWGGEQTKAWVAASIENFERYDFSVIGLVPVRNTYPVERYAQLDFYTAHPPLIVYVPAITTRLFGFSEFSIRYAYAIATFLSAAAVYLIGQRLYGEKIGLLALGFYALTPMILYHGRTIGHESLGLLAGTLFAAVLINWLRAPTKERFYALVALAWLAVWTAWMAAFFVAVMGAFAFFMGTRRHKVGIVYLAMQTVLAFAVLMAFYEVQWSGAIQQLIDRFTYRSGDTTLRLADESFTMLDWLLSQLAHIVFLITPGLTLMAVWGIFSAQKHGTRQANGLLLALFLSGASYQGVFRNASYIHDYYKISLVPSMAIAGGLAYYYGRRNPRLRRWSRPVLDGAVIFGLVAVGAFVLWATYSVEATPWLDDVIAVIEAEAMPGDLLMTNFSDPADSLTIGFYTARRIYWAETPERALQIAEESGRRVLYIECRNLPFVETQLSVNSPSGFGDVSRRVGDLCAMTVIK